MSTVQRSGTQKSGLHRSATRRAPANTTAAPVSKKKTYEDAQQGIKEINVPKNQKAAPDVDVVFVPGLGAHPEQSWQSTKGTFSWINDEDGLRRDFPKARFLLYRYESAWVGGLKVRQFIYNIADNLLGALITKREKCPMRPIVFIGHSMGGLVIAKVIALADTRKDRYPNVFEAITGGIFFGTPFGGTAVAQAAALYASLAEKVGAATTSKLLTFMEEGNEELRELVHDLMRLTTKITPKIELFCFYEQELTDFTKIAGLPSILSYVAKAAIPKEYTDFVTRESATLQGIDHRGLKSNHRDLVKFDSPKDERWLQFVREPLKNIIAGAQLSARNRFKSNREIDQAVVTNIQKVLEGGQIHKKRQKLELTFAPSSWIPKEAEYIEWLGPQPSLVVATEHDDESPKLPAGDCVWIRGRQGRGKTNATMAALQEIEKVMRFNAQLKSGEDPILLAYFFCDSQPDFDTAEDILKSIILQLIEQQASLAAYAKVFSSKKKSSNDQAQQSTASTQQAQVTIENLWQTLQDMLSDEFIGSRIYFVINNLHILSPEADSTIKLMRFLLAEFSHIMSEDSRHVRTRWLITSRESHGIQQALNVDGVRLIDLEDSKYEDQVQLELRKHARKMISTLGNEKNYNQALTYFASSLIGKRAQNTQWIDITCVQLSVLNKEESDLRVRKMLERMPEDLTTLLNGSWQKLFAPNDLDVEKIQEILRALVLTYEDPTESELEVLAGLASSDHDKAELRRLLEMCKPLVVVQRAGNEEPTVSFLNVVVKTHLRENAKQLLGLSEEGTKWQHGVLALRCFEYLNEHYDFPDPESVDHEAESEAGDEDDADEDSDDSQSQVEGADDQGEDQSVEQDNDNEDDAASSANSWISDDDSETSEDEDPNKAMEKTMVRNVSLRYTVKHWLHHASKATLEIAEDLSLEHEFWKPDSRIRRRWLIAFCMYTHTFDGFDLATLTGLHVGAAVGFRALVEALIRNGHEAEITQRDELFNSPLHFAAYLGRPGIVEELLNRGAPVDDAHELGEQSPLHMAAFGGHTEVMKKLILRGANPNGIGDEIGPVVNAAISSGSRAAVELLVEHGVLLHVEDDPSGSRAPLAHAACLSDPPMFQYLIEKFADDLPAEEFSKALVAAAESGRPEVFNKLLEFQHAQEYYQQAIETAAEEANWDVVMVLLNHCQGLDCDEVFVAAACSPEPQNKVLQAIWKHDTNHVSKEATERALYEATDYEKNDTVKLLLEEFKVNPNATGDEYGNALTAAAYDNNMELVQLLIANGADVNSPDGWALQSAASEGHYEIVEELLKHNADVNACTTDENFPAGTALQGACEGSRTEIVALLLEKGADPNRGSGTGAPPLVAAANQGDSEILALLVKAKADVNVFGGYDNSTPLINAAQYMPHSSLQLLLDAGADINLPDNDGDTALIVAAWGDETDTVTFLLDNGADILHVSNRNENALQGAVNNERWECVQILVERLSVILKAVKSAVDDGNVEVTRVIRSAVTSKQELDYGEDDDSGGHVGGSSETNTAGVNTPQIETARAVVISSPTPSIPGMEAALQMPTSVNQIDGQPTQKSFAVDNSPVHSLGQTSRAQQQQYEGNSVDNGAVVAPSSSDDLTAELDRALGHQIRLYNELSFPRKPVPPTEGDESQAQRQSRAPSWGAQDSEVISWTKPQQALNDQAVSSNNSVNNGVTGATPVQNPSYSGSSQLPIQTPASQQSQPAQPPPPVQAEQQQQQPQPVAPMPSYYYQYETEAASPVQPVAQPQLQEATPAQTYAAYQQSPPPAPTAASSIYDGGDYGSGSQFAAYQPEANAYSNAGYANQAGGGQQAQYNQWYQQHNGYYGEQQQQQQQQQPQQQQYQQAYRPQPVQQQQQQQQQQQYDGGGYVSASQQWTTTQQQANSSPPPAMPSRPEVRPQRSSFFGVKNTFSKAMGGKGSWS